MSGFRSIAEITNADEEGRVWLTGFRKMVASAASPTSGLIDYLYYAGSPPANFYASAPLASALIESARGIYTPPVGAGQKKYVKSLLTLSGAASATTTSSQRQRLIMADYLLYYPFIDTDAIGEQQDMRQVAVLPDRYQYGQVMAISQSAGATIGQFRINYTNELGESGRVSQNTFTQIVAGGGMVVSSGGSGAGFHPYVALQLGDKGVKSIESVTFTVAGGGLLALVLVKPLFTSIVSAECRRTTSSDLYSVGAADHLEMILHQAGMPEVKDGAVLGIFGQGFAGSLASSTLVGLLETVWTA